MLARLESELGRPLYRAFDLIAGTSIGSILALALARGVAAADLVDFFRREGSVIFPKATLWRSVQRWLHPKYSADAPKGSLEAALADGTFATLKTHVLVPAVALADSSPAVFRTQNGAQPASSVSLVDAALASSAAPTYFSPHTIGNQQYVDGGLIANSPDAMALTEANAVIGWPLSTLHVLSVGTTAVPTGQAVEPGGHWGLLRWGWKLTLLEQMMAAQAKLSRDSARQSLGARFLAIDAVRAPEQDCVIGLDRASRVATQTLTAMADAAWERVRGEEAQVIELLKLHHR